jgi:CHASE3 domain sensor protein
MKEEWDFWLPLFVFIMLIIVVASYKQLSETRAKLRERNAPQLSLTNNLPSK